MGCFNFNDKKIFTLKDVQTILTKPTAYMRSYRKVSMRFSNLWFENEEHSLPTILGFTYTNITDTSRIAKQPTLIWDRGYSSLTTTVVELKCITYLFLLFEFWFSNCLTKGGSFKESMEWKILKFLPPGSDSFSHLTDKGSLVSCTCTTFLFECALPVDPGELLDAGSSC